MTLSSPGRRNEATLELLLPTPSTPSNPRPSPNRLRLLGFTTWLFAVTGITGATFSLGSPPPNTPTTNRIAPKQTRFDGTAISSSNLSGPLIIIIVILFQAKTKTTTAHAKDKRRKMRAV